MEEARRLGEDGLAPQPDARSIAAIIHATFWASFRPEEGRFPKISLAYLPPEAARQPMVFEHPLPLIAGVLRKLAPAVERPEIHLGVWNYGDELKVWGTTRTIPSFCFVLEDIEPGLLVVKHRRLDGLGKYANVAVLKGEQVKVEGKVRIHAAEAEGRRSILSSQGAVGHTERETSQTRSADRTQCSGSSFDDVCASLIK